MGKPDPIGRLYDRLLASESGKIARSDFTIHKRLKFSEADQQKGIFDINDLLKQVIELPAAAHILDAGCGVGGSLFALLDGQRTGLGVSLSRSQIEVARLEANRRQLDGRCRFEIQSYDDPISGRFDLVLAIEALIHSPNLERSIHNLSRVLKSGGLMVMVEDMACAAVNHLTAAAVFKQNWRLHGIYSEEDYARALAAAGLSIVKEVDLTPHVHTHRWSKMAVFTLGKFISWLPAAWVGVLDINAGGWALETLYRQGVIKYKLIVAWK